MSVFIGVLIVMLFLLLEIMIGIIILALRMKKRRLNNIDIAIFEMTKQGIQVRHEMGRKEIDVHRGPRIVVAGFYPSSIKESLGYEIKDEHMFFSKKGQGRRYLPVAVKDGVYAPLQYAKKAKHLNLSKEEKALIDKLIEKNIFPFDGLDNPETLSLSPVQYDAGRFMLDVQMDVKDVYGDKNAELMRTLTRWAFFAIITLALLVTVTMVLFFTLGPDFFASRAAAAAVETAPTLTPIPGVTIPV
jgi:uncharacterized protein YneF (UPF0154 family)